MSRQLVACMLNVSEGRRISVVEKIAKAALSASNPPTRAPSVPNWTINATVLNIFQDVDYNRSVLTIVSNEDNIGPCIEAACKTAYELIDLSKHEGVHPRLGAVDLVPLHPISENMSVQSLGHIANSKYQKLLSSQNFG
ncbi:glutamate formimidoyltransferase-like [Homarus americanus]|uniref:glutamate formimidoyltransferase-like n=1 Tax=Homarus americanus TaxID=6706 RepID=UPI001C442C68|nr:glutamate formimidoyltransferase-like [Homarus americanus]